MALAVLGAVAFNLPASAQTNDWKANCSTDRMTDKKRCVVIKTVRPEGPRPYLMLFFSLTDGVFGVAANGIGERARIRVDKNTALESGDCGRSGCIFDLVNSVALADQMSRGNVALVEFTTTGGRVIGPYEFGTDGFVIEYQRGRATIAE